MNRLLIPAVAGAAILIGMGSPPAYAVVEVDATVSKTKDINVIEIIDIDKFVDITARVSINVDKAAEADTIMNQENHDNRACSSCAEKLDWIHNSITGNTGVLSVNQAAGNNNNQGNSVSVAVDKPPSQQPPPDIPPPPQTGTGGFANAQASVDQVNGLFKTVTVRSNVDNRRDDPFATVARTPSPNIVDSVGIVFREARIENSINDNLGVLGVNQATGNNNNQANAVAIALSLSGGVAMTESDLGQENANNIVHEREVFKEAKILGSVNDNRGIFGVNQTSGNMANQANVMGLSAAIVTQ